jgi:hypothetical protein
VLKNSSPTDLVNVSVISRECSDPLTETDLQIPKSLTPVFIKLTEVATNLQRITARAPEGRDERENIMAKKLKKSKKLEATKPLIKRGN